ncbi:MAG: penicillin-binding protein activator LpoB [Chitinivibrionales bacterium]|nr:penicillin-binding protein activator LpoB [Chitinivibrionales bacterium]
MRKGMLFFMVSFVALSIIGCGGKQVTRIDPNTTTDLSGKWNDTDSRLVAEEMIDDCLSRPWLNNNYPNSQPTIIVGNVRNKSHEHINVETFVKDLERTLINSGEVEFVASKDERIQIREEKADQMSGNASEETMKMAGNETGADLMLIGSINTIADQEGNKRVMYYQVDMELIEIESNKKLWIGNKKIKKHITKSKAKL